MPFGPFKNFQEAVEYAKSRGVKKPEAYAAAIERRIKNAKQKKGFDFNVVKDEEDGDFIFEAWGTVEIVDKDGQILSVDDMLKHMPTLMKRGAPIHFGHTAQHVGKIIDYKKEMYKDEETGKEIPGIKIMGKIFGDYPEDLRVRDLIRNGTVQMVSYGGESHAREFLEGRAGTAELKKKLTNWEWSIVERGKNMLSNMTKLFDGGKVTVLAKGEVSNEDLLKDDSFRTGLLQSLINEGLTFQEAMATAKGILDGTIGQEVESNMPDEGNAQQNEGAPEGSTIEDLTKGIEDNRKSIEALTKGQEEILAMLKGLLEKGKEEAKDGEEEEQKKELVLPNDKNAGKKPNPPAPITKGADEDLSDKIVKGVVTALKEVGFTGSGTPERPATENAPEQGEGSGVLSPEVVAKGFEEFLSSRLQKGEGEEFSFEKMRESLLGEEQRLTVSHGGATNE